MKRLAFLLVALLFGGTVWAGPVQEKNKAVARAFVEEVLCQGKLERYIDFHTADYMGHSSELGDFNVAEDLAAAREERKALPDMQFAVNHMVAEGDLVVVHWTMWGTNTQPGMGLPATGKPIKISGMTLFRFRAGKISEEWNAYNMLSVLKQAGLFPPKGLTGQEPKFPTHDPTNP